jgi:HNH endonuclease
MRGKHGNHAKGPAHYKWSEERMISDDGYAKLRVGVDHPLADPNGYAYEHLVIWIAAGNLRPPRNKHLHHKNEHRTDNRLSNLELLTIPEHADRHGRLRLTKYNAREIRERYAAGTATQADLAADYFVPVQRISKVIHGQVWRDAGGPISTVDHRHRDPATGRIIGKKLAGALLDGREHKDFPHAQ